MVLPTKKIKIEFYDERGTKHTVIVEGTITRENVVKIFDYIELMGGVSAEIASPRDLFNSPRNTFEKVQAIISNNFHNKFFNSREVRKFFSDTYGEKIKLSTVSTYLTRLVDRGMLIRSSFSGEWRYAVKTMAPPRSNLTQL